MKTPLATNSATYLRRLARELNALGDGFYCYGSRWNRAQCKTFNGDNTIGYLMISQPHEDGASGHTNSRAVTSERLGEICDAYGRTVYASRKAPKS